MKHCWPTLYSKSKSGKIKQWNISVVCDDTGGVSVVKSYGYIDGKQTEAVKNIYTGKNIGKANATLPLKQAENEAKAGWQKRIDDGWIEDINNVNNIVCLPMKAGNKTSNCEVHMANLRGKYTKYYLQRKLNGVRCFAIKTDETTIKYISIKNREFLTLDHLTPWLTKIMQVGQIFDGELYIHGVFLNKIVSYVKRKQPNTGQICFHVYDLAVPNTPYSVRKSMLDQIFIDYSNSLSDDMFITICPIKNEQTIELETVDKFKEWHDKFISEGYEGAIIRLPDGKYEFNQRSNTVLKIKDFIDEEFIVVGGHEGTGDEEGCVIFDLITDDGKRFSARPEGTREERAVWFRTLHKFINKKITVRFFEYTEYGVPQFPVAICVRDYE